MFEEGVLSIGLLAVAFMAFVEVVRRYLFGESFTWFEEFSRYYCVFLTFLGASLGVKYGMHFSMDYVVTRVNSRAGHVLRIVGYIISALVFGAVAWLAWEHSVKMYRFGTTSAAMGISMFWAYLPISIFSATMVIRFGYQAYRHARGFLSGTPVDFSEKA